MFSSPAMEINECADQRQRLLSSAENRETQQNYEEDDDDEAISLRNLPLIHHHQQNISNEEHTDTNTTTLPEAEDDFNFCSPKEESEMRAADEIFFRGQILPQNKFQQHKHNSISRSHSMDHYFSADLIRSSGGGGAVTRNQFHSHPSPSPRIVRNRQQMIRNNNRKCVQKSASWNVFRGGLIAGPPEIIAFGDLKSRCSGKNGMRSEKKRGKVWDIVGGCKCSVDDAIIDATISPQIAIVKRSATGEEEENSAMKKSVNHRTSEWLKQLSLQRTAAAER